MSSINEPQQMPSFDPSLFSTDPYVRRIEKPWGYELHFAQESLPYMGKIMHINAECRQSMQVHDKKQETYLLIAGRAKVIWENNQGELVETELEMRKGYTTLIGQKHRLCGITDCDIVEFSTPEAGTTWRLDDDYAREHQTPEERAAEYARNQKNS